MRGGLALFLLVALLLFPNLGAEFAEYSEQLQPIAASPINALLFASSCNGINGDFELAYSGMKTESFFANNINLASYCRQRLQVAKGIARLQALEPLPGAIYRGHSFYCFSEAIAGLGACLEADRSSLKTLDTIFNELEYATGKNYSGQAQGILSEAKEAQAQINSEGSSKFANAFNSASSASKTAFGSLQAQPIGSLFTAAANLLAKKSGSLLEQEIMLTKKAVTALEELENEFDEVKQSTELEKTLATTRLNLLEEQALHLANEDAARLVLAEKTSIVESSQNTGTFTEELAKAKAKKEEADEFLESATKILNAKKHGFNGNALAALEQAIKLYQASNNQLIQIEQRSQLLEKTLESALAEQREQLREKIQTKNGAAESLARANALLESEEKDLMESRASSRGARIALLTSHLRRINNALSIAFQSDSANEMREELRGESKRLAQLLDRLSKDGVELFTEKESLQSITTALENAVGLDALIELQKNLQKLMALQKKRRLKSTPGLKKNGITCKRLLRR